MIALWVKSIEFAIITWRTRGFLRATPDTILSWYGRGEITADMVKGVFEPNSFTAKEARIYAADIWADPGKERNAMALSERAMKEGLKHNIVPETVYYVDVNEVMEGLFEPGDHYWKQEGGHIRALNTANMMDYVIKEYLATPQL
jgi:hypothetical protein